MRHISDRKNGMKSTQTVDSRILRRIRATKGARVFSPGHFLDLGTRASVDQALSRLFRAGVLRRVGRGLYDLPRAHPWFGILSPRAEEVAGTVAARGGQKLRMSEAASANALGLSEQVPGKLVFQTDGKSRKLKVAGQEVELRHRPLREMALSAHPTGMIVSALRSMGKNGVNPGQLDTLRASLPAKDRRILLKELPLVPAWMHPFLRYLATGKRTP